MKSSRQEFGRAEEEPAVGVNAVLGGVSLSETHGKQRGLDALPKTLWMSLLLLFNDAGFDSSGGQINTTTIETAYLPEILDPRQTTTGCIDLLLVFITECVCAVKFEGFDPLTIAAAMFRKEPDGKKRIHDIYVLLAFALTRSFNIDKVKSLNALSAKALAAIIKKYGMVPKAINAQDIVSSCSCFPLASFTSPSRCVPPDDIISWTFSTTCSLCFSWSNDRQDVGLL
eukprot:GHVR01028487.1.p1 GENE.GHVR01028487.1~~GHVR01028487.1.p1  ORF type:complete len:228 (-),score=22.13 GHVR01028487.1:51-734(-)